MKLLVLTRGDSELLAMRQQGDFRVRSTTDETSLLEVTATRMKRIKRISVRRLRCEEEGNVKTKGHGVK